MGEEGFDDSRSEVPNLSVPALIGHDFSARVVHISGALEKQTKDLIFCLFPESRVVLGSECFQDEVL